MPTKANLPLTREFRESFFSSRVGGFSRGGVLLTLLDSKALAQCPSFIAESKLFPFWAPDLLDFRGYYPTLTPNLENTLVTDRVCISMHPNITKYFARVA